MEGFCFFSRQLLFNIGIFLLLPAWQNEGIKTGFLSKSGVKFIIKHPHLLKHGQLFTQSLPETIDREIAPSLLHYNYIALTTDAHEKDIRTRPLGIDFNGG